MEEAASEPAIVTAAMPPMTNLRASDGRELMAEFFLCVSLVVARFQDAVGAENFLVKYQQLT
jgi:hypothetical protein